MKILSTMLVLMLLSTSAFGDYQPGFCPITGNRIISEYGRPMPNYTVVFFKLDNGSIMNLAVDKSIVNAISEADFDKIIEHVEAGWLWEMNKKKWPRERIDNYKDRFFGKKIVEYLGE